MSHRAKQILLTAVLLPLLGFPLLYVALTWEPADPLKFHAVVSPVNTSPPGSRLIEIHAENTSLVPVTLFFYSLNETREFAVPIDPDPMHVILAGPNTPTIQPGERALVWYSIKESDIMVADGGPTMQYACLSRTKLVALHQTTRLHECSPVWLHPHLPRVNLLFRSVPIMMPAIP